MSFKAEENSINNVLSRNNSYTIPLNQRKYVWTSHEWNELFEDVFLLEESDGYSHFLGSIVFSDTNEKNRFEVIDGQQRLITICILLCCIVNYSYKIGETKVAESISTTFLKGTNDGEEYFKLERKDGPFFLTQIVDKIDSYVPLSEMESEFSLNFSKADKYNERFLDCYRFFFGKIGQEIQNVSENKRKELLLSLKNKLVNCDVIEIKVSTDLDGYKIFETLNARGIPLEPHELVKNYIYSYMKGKTKQQKVINSWNRITNFLTKDNTEYFTSFLTHYCVHAYGKIKRGAEYKTIRDNTPKKKVEELLESLVRMAEWYRFFDQPDDYKSVPNYSDDIYSSLQFCKKMNIRQSRPLMLSLFELWGDNEKQNKEIEEAFKLLEVFYFLYVSVEKNTTNTIDLLITGQAKAIHENKSFSLSSLKTKLLMYLPSDTSILEGDFARLGFSNKNPKFKNSANKKLIQYVLHKIEHFYDINNELDVKIQSIEHIMSDSESNDVTSKLGNLLPMKSRLNSKVGNMPFVEKLKTYRRSNLLSMKKFLDNYGSLTEWNEDSINKRTSHIAHMAVTQIWRVD